MRSLSNKHQQLYNSHEKFLSVCALMQQHYLSFQRKNQYAALSNKCLLYGGAGIIVVFLSNHIIVPTSRGRLLSFSRPRVSLHDIINERESNYSRDGILHFQTSPSYTILYQNKISKSGNSYRMSVKIPA